MKWAFYDSDVEIEKRIGSSIADFFRMQGEALFREIEAATLNDLLKKKRSILATGGGVVLLPTSSQKLHDQSFVVYLFATPEEVYRRLGRDDRRPLLKVDDPLDKLRELFTQRDHMYRGVSHVIVPAGAASTEELIERILSRFESSCDPSLPL